MPTHIASRKHIFLPPLSPYVTRDTRVRFLTCGMVCVYARLFTERDVTSSSLLLEMRYVWEEERCVVGVRPKKKREGGLILHPLSICTYGRRYNTVGSDQNVTDKAKNYFQEAKSFNQFPVSIF